uniref:Integrase catalytic domain-containing protein n=1 Tax=Anopheles funestus TaxID=62324 RepID=A0A4Y0BGQ3_ANOFN
MAEQRRVKMLSKQRISIEQSVDAIHSFVIHFQDDSSSNEITVRLDTLEKLWEKFLKVQDDLEILDEDLFEDHLKKRTEMETKYYKAKGFLEMKVKETSKEASKDNLAPCHLTEMMARVKLPDLKLPVFDGKQLNWLRFHDLFQSMIHTSTTLSDTQKFYYLRSSLSETALQLIQSVPITGNNYNTAWNILLDHYNNADQLKQSYVEALFKPFVLKRESAADLRKLVDSFEANVKVLKQLGEPTEHWDTLLIHLLSQQLDPTSLRDWKEAASSIPNMKYADLIKFIQRRITVLDSLTPHGNNEAPKRATQRAVNIMAATNETRGCAFCSENHPIHTCSKFLKCSWSDKENIIREKSLCRNCLRTGHRSQSCRSSSNCRSCGKRHHTTLCLKSQPNLSRGQSTMIPQLNQRNEIDPSSNEEHTSIQSITCTSLGQSQRTVLLATASIILIDEKGMQHTARALLDSGSGTCLITNRLAQRMYCRREPISIRITGVGTTTTFAKQKLQATLRSRLNNYSANIEMIILPTLTGNLPSTSVNVMSLNIPSNIQLADPAFDRPDQIDVIIGAEIFFDVLQFQHTIRLGNNLPILTNSQLGWIISGPTPAESMQYSHSIVVNHCKTTIDDIQSQMETFWKVEEDPAASVLSIEERKCEDHYTSNVSRSSTGRYVVRLPVNKEKLSRVVDNRNMAIRRLSYLLARFKREPELQQQYASFIEEYVQLGHMKRIHESEYNNTSVQHYYLPHHAVMRSDSTTTKLRVVFDASSKTSSGVSLNDALLVGPTVQEDIRSIIIRARMHKVMVVADIKMMYRQVLVDSRDTPLQLIVWKPNPDQPLETYELKTVTYGTASAPFLATRTLIQLANDEGTSYPLAATILKRDFYVDDLFSGGANASEVSELVRQLIALLGKGGLQLRKWASNNETVLQQVPTEHRAIDTSIEFSSDHVIKTLGLHWEPKSDTLRYNIDLQLGLPNEQLTRRTLLSLIARIYDPLGLVGPVITTAKIFMQKLWTLRNVDGTAVNWDQELPADIQQLWNSFAMSLPKINELRISRCVITTNPISIQLHIFADASQVAYGTCAYIRSIDSHGTIKVALLASKSRVAPLKTLSIPRLELCGAVLAAELYVKLRASIHLPMECYFWLDSTVALHWLKAPPQKWNVFVGNRVSKIQNATQETMWNHVAGIENPADCISRGLSATELLEYDLWWNGPAWLTSCQTDWPVSSSLSEGLNEAMAEIRSSSDHTTILCCSSKEPTFIDQLISKFSRYSRLLRVIAYCLRMNCKLRTTSEYKPFNTIVQSHELKEAEHRILRAVQQNSFAKELLQLQRDGHVSSSSRLKWFHPFISPEKLIRVGGRLSNTQQPYDCKHQVLLPASHPLATLIVREYHEKHLHAAPQLLLNLLRQRYWIIGARSLAKRVVHNCITCARARPKLVEQLMSDLPSTRTTPSRPFSIVGVDFWGPINLAPIHRRAAPGRAFVAVFVCFSTKATHLELVTDLSSAKFLQAFRRFVSRRGLCQHVYSDNGRNFVGASNELRALLSSDSFKGDLLQECTSQGVQWHFNPPRASHFGGLWEAAIHSAQKHFIRVLGKTTLHADDMETLLCQIEACLNSRPLIAMSDDPSDFEPLTPGHFLIGSCLKSAPDADYDDIPMNRLKRWHLTQQIYQQLWKRWTAEYLSTLQPRSKWFKQPVTIKEGQLVMLRDQATKPMEWPLARIVKTHPGADGIVRVVTLQTKTGQYIRPVSKISILPVPVMESEQ